MQTLQIQDIISLFVVIDDCIKNDEKNIGRTSNLADSEVITILMWCTIILKQKLIKDIYKTVQHYHKEDFPKLPDYSNFVRHCHRVIPLLYQLLENSFSYDSKLRFADSTMIQVCKKVRANNHKVAKGLANFGKNHQGWHFGFKLHASINPQGYFCGIYFTPASFHDAQALPFLIQGNPKIVVGDTTYGARVIKEKLWKENGVFILAPPHPKQNKKIIVLWQKLLLEARPKIEAVFDILKEHMHLVSSFPRSIMGYLFHYLRIILAYQFKIALF